MPDEISKITGRQLSREEKITTNFNSSGHIENLGDGEQFGESGAIKKDILQEIVESNFIQNSTDMGWMDKFSRFSYVDPYNVLPSSKEYIFITRPDLHLFENENTNELNSELANNIYFQEEFNRYRHVMKELQYSTNKTKAFFPMLSNCVASSLELPPINGLESETSENIYGDKISYRHGSESGDVGFDFSLEFYETKNLEIYHLFKIWDRYYELKSKGRISPPSLSSQSGLQHPYVFNMELHDQISMYKIIVGEDMETILFYAKYYGVYPKNVPRDIFGSLDSGEIKLSIDFKAAFVIDNDPTILIDFNEISDLSGSTKKFINIWDNENNRVNYKWVGMPYIVYDKNISNGESTTGSTGGYRLKWREP